jgi:hypothetical protein
MNELVPKTIYGSAGAGPELASDQAPSMTMQQQSDLQPSESELDTESTLSSSAPPCRFCSAPLKHVFVDLGLSPLANSYVRPEDTGKGEHFFPLRVFVCGECLLVQLEEFESPEGIFGDYAYFSSFSDSWVEHARRYVEMATDRFGLDETSSVVEIASNDGYLLRHFVAKGVPCLGIEPAANIAEVAREEGIPTWTRFFGTELANELVERQGPADLIIGNNVLAHVPDLNDVVEGLRIALADSGVVTMEFPHLLRLIEENQFDTIYHEHFSYFSLLAVERVFAAHGLAIFDVDELPTHGGSLRIYARHTDNDDLPVTQAVHDLRAREIAAELDTLNGYEAYGDKVAATKRGLLRFLIDAKEAGKTVVGYGAPAKGNTLLNYCGVGPDLSRDAAGLRADPSVEPVRRDHEQHGPCSGLGRRVRRSHTRGPRSVEADQSPESRRFRPHKEVLG